MKRYILFILCALSAILFLTGCENKEERAQREKREHLAAEQAVQYIYEKYGFTPAVVAADSDYQQQIVGRHYYATRFLIQMQYEERAFLVWLDGDERRDSWQHEELYQTLREEIEKRVPGIMELTLTGCQFFKSNSYSDFRDCLCSEYFDGTNLLEVLNDCIGTFQAYYVHGDFSDESRFTWLNNTDSETEASSNGFRGHFISMRSEDAFAPVTAFGSIYGSDLGRGEKAVYIESYRNTEGVYEQYDLKQYGELYYLTYLNDYGYKPPGYDVLSISKGQPPSHQELLDITWDRAYIASEAFDFSVSKKAFVTVFYPILEIEGFDKRETKLLERWTDDEGESKHYCELVQQIGDYAVASAWYFPGDYSICFISTRDVEEYAEYQNN